MTKSILVTGSDGYIGAVLTNELLKQRYHVAGLDTLYFGNDVLGTYERKYWLIHKDIRNLTTKDLGNFDAIIHLASLSNDALGYIDPKLTEEINFHATIRLAKLAKVSEVQRFIFASSCSIYGIANDGIVDEDSTPRPLTAYARSKIHAEKALLQLASNSFSVSILRNATVYGFSPKFRSDLVVNNFVLSAVSTGKILVDSDGTPWRPLIDVRDLSAFIEAFLYAPQSAINGKIINLGFDENNVQVKTIIEEVAHVLPGCVIVFTGKHGSDTRSYRVSFQRCKTLFPHLKQLWPLGRSIRDMIIRLKKEKLDKKDFVMEKFDRMSQLKKLMEIKKIDHNLFWKKSYV